MTTQDPTIQKALRAMEASAGEIASARDRLRTAQHELKQLPGTARALRPGTRPEEYNLAAWLYQCCDAAFHDTSLDDRPEQLEGDAKNPLRALRRFKEEGAA
jgi:hypothetical protein